MSTIKNPYQLDKAYISILLNSEKNKSIALLYMVATISLSLIHVSSIQSTTPKTRQFSQLEDQWQIEFGQFYQQMLKDNPKGSGVI